MGDDLSANWHVRIEDRARLAAELVRLETRLVELDQRIAGAVNRQRYSRSPEDAERAGEDLKNLVAEMDRLMTRSRAVEGKLLILQKLTRKSEESRRDPCASSGNVSEHVVVEVYRNPSGTKMNG